HHEHGAAHRVTHAEQREVGGQAVDHGEAVVAEAGPVVGAGAGGAGVAVAPVVDGHAVVAGKVAGQRGPEQTMQAGGVRVEDRGSLPAQVVQGEADVIGGGDGRHRAMVPRRAPGAPTYAGPMAAGDDVLAANRRFYEAFEASDIDAMSDVWVHDDGAVCTHPGWATLHGWAAIAAS